MKTNSVSLENSWLEESWISLDPKQLVIVESKCNHCGNDGKIRYPDAECYICAMDNYCENAENCKCCRT